jgi:hypothetical protein
MTTKFKLTTVTFAALLASAPLGAQAPASKVPGPQSTAATTTASKDSGGWVQLFDGKDLKGWRGYKKTDTTGTRWKVENGLLTIPQTGAGDTKGQQDIITDATFEQFDLRWEWKISQGGNSGVKYFVLEDQPSAIGHEYQMIDDDRHPDGKLIRHKTGDLYDLISSNERKHVRPIGEWNESRVVFRGMHGEHWLNGEKVVEYDLGTPAMQAAVAASKYKVYPWFAERRRGHIVLQDHGDEVYFRHIRIRELDGAGRSATR